jgi:magnesium-transporting ATPase (P-type)
MDWVALLAGEENQKYQRAALILRTLAWMGITWAALISIWIWMGLKAGSNWWLWGAIGMVVICCVILAIAAALQAKAAEFVPVPRAPEDRSRAA